MFLRHRRRLSSRRPRLRLSLETLEDRSLLSASVPDSGLLQLIEPIQAQVVPDSFQALDEQSNALIGVTSLRGDSKFAGVDGRGIGVAVIDTGIDVDQPANLTVKGGANFAGGSSFDDNNSHGTHVAGIIASNRSGYVGVAPGADLYAVKVLNSGGSGSALGIANGLQWVIDHAAADNIKVVNMSLGDGGNYPQDVGNSVFGSIHSKIQTLQSMGIVVVSAAGNSYFQYQSPGSSDPGSTSTIDVGAVYSADFGPLSWSSGAVDNTTGPDRIVSFSQRDPNNSRFVMAPGALITSTVPVELDNDGTRDGLATFAGTSMATPQVTGIVALMQNAAQQFGGTYLSPTQVVSILLRTATMVNDGDNENDNVVNTGANYARVDAYAAVKWVADLFTPPTPTHDVAVTSITAAPNPVTVGGTVTVQVNVRNAGTFDESGIVVTVVSDNATPSDPSDDFTIGTSSPLSLTAGQSTTVTFSWNTTGAKLGTHTLLAHQSLADDNPSNDSASRTVTVQAVPPPPPSNSLYLTVRNNTTLNGIPFANEDIIAWNGTSYSMLFDGSDVGLGGPFGGFAIDGFTVLSPTQILISLDQAGTVPGISGFVKDEDVLLFTATSLGNNTSGTWSMFFRGSNYGLSTSLFGGTTGAEGIDELEYLAPNAAHPLGQMLVSTKGDFSVPGLSGGREDVIAFDLGTRTGSMFFDGSNFGLSGGSAENVDGIAVGSDGKLYLSTTGDFSVPGVSGANEDVFVFNPATGSYSPTLFFDGSTAGLASNDVSGISLPAGGGSSIDFRMLTPLDGDGTEGTPAPQSQETAPAAEAFPAAPAATVVVRAALSSAPLSARLDPTLVIGLSNPGLTTAVGGGSQNVLANGLGKQDLPAPTLRPIPASALAAEIAALVKNAPVDGQSDAEGSMDDGPAIRPLAVPPMAEQASMGRTAPSGQGQNLEEARWLALEAFVDAPTPGETADEPTTSAFSTSVAALTLFSGLIGLNLRAARRDELAEDEEVAGLTHRPV